MAETRFDMQKQDYMSLCKAYLTEELSKRKVNQKALLKAELLCEEAILKVAQYAREDTTLSIRIRRSIGGTYVEIQAKGEEIPELFGDGNISYAAKTLESSEEDIDTGLVRSRRPNGLLGSNYASNATGQKSRVGQMGNRAVTTRHITLNRD